MVVVPIGLLRLARDGLLCTSMSTSSFFKPGNSDVVVTRFFFLSSCRSILFDRS